MVDFIQHLLMLFVLCTMTTACVSTSVQIPSEPAPVDDRSVDRDDVSILSNDSIIRSEPIHGTQKMSRAVHSLLVSANTSMNIGNVDAAANSLERALRLEPRNALLWSRLAAVNFNQQKWQQAIQFASKSNTMAVNQQHIRRENWLLIGDSYDALGDLVRAQKARSKLRSY